MASEAHDPDVNASEDDHGDLAPESIADDNTTVATSSASATSDADGNASDANDADGNASEDESAVPLATRVTYSFRVSRISDMADRTLLNHFNKLDGIEVVHFVRLEHDNNQAILTVSMFKATFISGDHPVGKRLIYIVPYQANPDRSASEDDSGDVPPEPSSASDDDNTTVAASSASAASGASSVPAVLAATRVTYQLRNISDKAEQTLLNYFEGLDGVEKVIEIARLEHDNDQAILALLIAPGKTISFGSHRIHEGVYVEVNQDDSKDESLQAVAPQLRERVNNREVCKYFVLGNCPHGDNCWYPHDANLQVKSICCSSTR